MTKRVMCPPTYFDIEYSINPWMDVTNKVNKELADSQWQDFVSTLHELGDDVELVDPDPRCPDMTFSGDAGFVYRNCFVPSNFSVTERKLEVEHYVRWFEQRGYEILRMPEQISFEGLGDVVFYGNRAIIGHGIRSDKKSIDFVQRLVPELQMLGDMHIVDDRYFHLAMALGFLDDETVVYYPGAFDERSIDKLHQMVRDPIAVSDVDANEYFACNNVVIDRTVLLDNATPELRAALTNRGFEVRACPMSEFKKSGGSLRCLVLTFLEGARSST